MDIGSKFQVLDLAGHLLVFNPHPSNRIIIVGKEGKIIRSIYRYSSSNETPHVLTNIAVDSTAGEIYLYSPFQHAIFVYDADGSYKKKIFIQQILHGRFARLNGKFAFRDAKDSVTDHHKPNYILWIQQGSISKACNKSVPHFVWRCTASISDFLQTFVIRFFQESGFFVGRFRVKPQNFTILPLNC